MCCFTTPVTAIYVLILLKPIARLGPGRLNYSNMATASEFLKYKKSTYHCLKADHNFSFSKARQKQAI